MSNLQEQKGISSFDGAILKKEEIGDTSGEVYHIAFSGTSNYLVHTGISMVSILESNPKRAFHFHVFINGIEPEPLDGIFRVCSSKDNHGRVRK